MTSRGFAFCVSVGVAVLGLGGSARGAASPDTATVLGKLHHANQMEVAAGKLAEEKGQAKDVKSFGKTLVTDHTAADKKVMALAKAEKIELPAPAKPTTTRCWTSSGQPRARSSTRCSRRTCSRITRKTSRR